MTYILALLLAAASCTSFGNCTKAAYVPAIFPDYTDITIPCNIAPLNFNLEGADALELTAAGEKGYYVFRSHSHHMRFPMKRWKQMLKAEQGNELRITLRAEADSKAVEYEPFVWVVSADRIDSHISYRLIEPAYEVWNTLTVNERCLESFDERALADNAVTEEACINCHTSNRAPNPTTYMHVRGPKGGTLYTRDGEVRKFNTATDSTAGAAVYGEISADGRYGIFTTADIRNCLHSNRLGRLEVYDASSDLILIDFENSTVTDSPAVKGSEFQETFPCWSADGRTVYFCRAASLEQPSATRGMHYDLYSVTFDPQTGRLGDDIAKVIDAAALGVSFSFPKCSPDGRHILLTVSRYGTFPIWHEDTDLWMYDLVTGTIDRLEAANGPYSDSYHCWSSDGRWICWASKRADRVYGRPYFAHVAEDGTVSKAFVLPQRNPDTYLTTLKSYNIPEIYDIPEAWGARFVGRSLDALKVERMEYKSINL